MYTPHPKFRTLIPLLLVTGQLAACAATPDTDEESAAAHDPWEPMNRPIFSFNMAVDKATLRPLARGYQKITPNFARRGVTNFFDNLTTPGSALNNFLQGKPARGFNELGRFLFNSTLGVGGLVDIADLGGMERHEEDFAQTFAVWGIPEGPYLV
ncbi:MAG: VacJ family lipoprotein, partial [Gammaproteobacteria bacterium]|nr:VacJ family lipoprotein [Gammaproteobacteria bacterium]